MNIEHLANIVEAILMVADKPITANKLLELIGETGLEMSHIKDVMAHLQIIYQHRGVELVEVSSGYRFQAAAKYQQYFQRLFEERPPKYSKALLETLAIVAYRQPVTRADVESIRGVAVSSHIMKTLLEREWIKIVGHRDVPGKPGIYATTKQFLDYFGLKSLESLPPLEEIKSMEQLLEKNGQDVESSSEELSTEEPSSVSNDEQTSSEEAASEVHSEVAENENEPENIDNEPLVNSTEPSILDELVVEKSEQLGEGQSGDHIVPQKTESPPIEDEEQA